MIRSVTWGASCMGLFGFALVATIAAFTLATAGIRAANTMDAFFSLSVYVKNCASYDGSNHADDDQIGHGYTSLFAGNGIILFQAFVGFGDHHRDNGNKDGDSTNTTDGTGNMELCGIIEKRADGVYQESNGKTNG